MNALIRPGEPWAKVNDTGSDDIVSVDDGVDGDVSPAVEDSVADESPVGAADDSVDAAELAAGASVDDDSLSSDPHPAAATAMTAPRSNPVNRPALVYIAIPFMIWSSGVVPGTKSSSPRC
jgi:hypothetical protein